MDDYHSLDRNGRKKEGVTALDPKAQNFDLMYEQIRDLKAGKPVQKPIYNHVSGLLDPPETIKSPSVGCCSVLSVILANVASLEARHKEEYLPSQIDQLTAKGSRVRAWQARMIDHRAVQLTK